MQRAEEEEKYQAVVQAKGYYEQAHAKAELTLPANHPLLLEVRQLDTALDCAIVYLDDYYD